MQNDRIKQLKTRASELVNEMFPLNDEQIEHVEKSLNVILPEDFKILCKHCSYESFSFFENHTFRNNNINNVMYNSEVIFRTRDDRKILNLPHEYILLSGNDDGGALILKTIDDKNSQVIWCDSEDFYNVCGGRPLEYKPTIFESFTDFYEFLLDEEERIIAEDKEQ